MRDFKMLKGTTWLKDSDYDNTDQVDIYERTLIDVFENPGYYLDSLDYIPEYRVYFGNYTNRSSTSGITHLPEGSKTREISLLNDTFIKKVSPI